ncbi:hypothetical protein PVE_R2G0175 [Pseudomonas veronii 1YdBTEX2]|uniref:Uncharacterized protein n=1 Tax=Pseudomonas veronii 1YdBTEX2 TaxID=1295141 RepID=A0A1D3K774_PSEVE|nr:hypothetical protein PVE_R2G0175 [Pseudomonas veronii 1YdBTEX2]
MSSVHLPLRRLQFRDALITAPVSLTRIGVVLRVLDAFLDGIYGSLRPDIIVMGNDPLVGICAALSLADQGKKVVIAPDTLDAKSWPNPDYAKNAFAIFNSWDETIAEEVRSHFPSVPAGVSMAECLSVLCRACKATGRVTLIEGATFQTSHGHIRGEAGREVLFPIRPDQRDAAGINPAWKYLSRRLHRTIINHDEIEFISTRSVLLTSHPSSFVDSSGSAYKRVGQARINKPEVVDNDGRIDDLRSALSKGTPQCSQA